VETKPKFKDGKDETLLKWINDNSVYPKICIDNNIEGRVWVGFTIDHQGKVTDVHILRNVDPYLDAEDAIIYSNDMRYITEFPFSSYRLISVSTQGLFYINDINDTIKNHLRNRLRHRTLESIFQR